MNESLNQAKENIEKLGPKCLFIDDHASMVSSLRRFLKSFDNFLAAECHSVDDAMNAIKENSPKVIFLDNSLTPGGNEGIQIAKMVKEMYPDIKIYSTTTSPGVERVYEKMGISHIEKGDTDTMQAILSGK